MKENENTTIIALGFFAFMTIIAIGLLYLLKKEPIPTTTAQTAQPQQVYIPQPVSQGVVKTQEVRPTTAHMINHHLNNANQWYEIKLSRNLKNWQIRCRGEYDLLYSYSPAHQNYFTLSSGDVLSSDTSPNADLNAIYVMCETSGVVVEMEIWEK